MINEQRRERLKGVIVDFDLDKFDPDTAFLKIGKGSLGGKARGLAHLCHLCCTERTAFLQSFDNVDIFVPQTLVITTEGFDLFIRINQLEAIVKADLPDEVVAQRFMAADFPKRLNPDWFRILTAFAIL